MSGELNPAQLDPMARMLFAVALNSGRCGQLFACLLEGGSATVDGDGNLVMVTADMLRQMGDGG